MNLVRAAKFAALVAVSGFALFLPRPAAAQLTGFQEYFIPGKEDQLREIFRSFSTSVGTEMHAVIAATAASDTVIYYDHWEDGYDFDPANPEATYDEKLSVAAGTSHVFENGGIPSFPRVP